MSKHNKPRTPRRISIRMAMLVVALGLSGFAKADFNDGVVALSMGQYDQALQTFLPLAETSDHAYAQYFLGRMYADGRGVEQDKAKAYPALLQVY